LRRGTEVASEEDVEEQCNPGDEGIEQ